MRRDSTRHVLLGILCLLMLEGGLRLPARAAQEQSQARAEYLSERGIVLPIHEVRIDELLSAFDFQYPEPEGDFGIQLYAANNLFPVSGGEQIIMIGVQGRRMGREARAPIEIVVAVDRSGSMGEPDKLEWVKDSLEVLIDALRDDDRICLTTFDERGEILMPLTRAGAGGVRDRFRDAVRGITAGGESDLIAGLRTAIEAAAGGPAAGEPGVGETEAESDAAESAQVADRAAPRVFLLSDGWGRTAGLASVLRLYRQRGVAVTCVGYGQRYDAVAMRAIKDGTGGTTRFISDRERLEEVFGGGLERTTVPLATDINITVDMRNVNYFRTWGYGYTVNSFTDTVTYTIPAIYSGDYETMLIVADMHGFGREREQTLASMTATYRDLEGREQAYEPLELKIEYVTMDDPLSGPSDSRVLLASNLLAYSEVLMDAASVSRYGYGSPYGLFFATWDMRKRLVDTSRRLDYQGFTDEIAVLDNYLRILGDQMGLKKSTVSLLISDDELRPPVEDRPLDVHLANMFEEMYLSLEARPPGNVAVADFTVLQGGGLEAAIPGYLGEAAGVWLSRLAAAGFQIVERRNLDAVLREQEFSLSDLADQQNAARVGMFLAADYVLTGSVLEMEESVVIFSRIINVETAVIETAAQVIVPKEDIPLELL